MGLCDAGGMSAASPFEPAGVQWTAVSPRLALARRLLVAGAGWP